MGSSRSVYILELREGGRWQAIKVCSSMRAARIAFSDSDFSHNIWDARIVRFDYLDADVVAERRNPYGNGNYANHEGND